MCRWFDSAPGHQKKFNLVNRLEMSSKESGPSKGRFFVFLTQYLQFVLEIDCEAADCDCPPVRGWMTREGHTPHWPGGRTETSDRVFCPSKVAAGLAQYGDGHRDNPPEIGSGLQHLKLVGAFNVWTELGVGLCFWIPSTVSYLRNGLIGVRYRISQPKSEADHGYAMSRSAR